MSIFDKNILYDDKYLTKFEKDIIFNGIYQSICNSKSIQDVEYEHDYDMKFDPIYVTLGSIFSECKIINPYDFEKAIIGLIDKKYIILSKGNTCKIAIITNNGLTEIKRMLNDLYDSKIWNI